MRVDFYQLTRDPAVRVVPQLAQKVMDAGARLLIVAAEAAERQALSDALWTQRPDSFLAHGEGDGERADCQPILLSDRCEAANGAAMCMIADGEWRDQALAFERTFYLFPPERTDMARDAWRGLSKRDGAEPHYWRQQDGRWVEGP